MVEIQAEKERIVVGVDGSKPSQDALRWAVRQARLVTGVVQAVIAWDYPQLYGLSSWVPTPENPTPEGVARSVLSATIDEVVGPERPVGIQSVVSRGSAAQVLLEAAEGASLLVVGNRGHGGFTGALIGSVSQHCAQHAHCPVVVLRGTKD
ncbi:universal stress protein [Kitasatospora sp. GP82]|uniref:universal stress protein n=1 Tax=Kitasatospora sp. GP82 TaxID=3035089 RepID=UPI002474580E|nr:universal stress protein [Kitasatospora sp. GP82]MDH6127316.1 nucleotide-binding universal stress UspA family protein [Kitasatospora sp. GP82]